MKTFHTLSFVISIVLALIFSAGFSSPVLADEAPPITEQEPSLISDEKPPPPSEGEVDSANLNQAPTQTEDAPSPVEETEISQANTLTEEVLEQLPPETQIVVLDEEGEALPLATQEAENVIYAGDPMWCPAGVTPGSSTCSQSFFYFNGSGGLLEWLANNPPNTAGVIWIESSYVGTSALEGGTVFINGGNYALTINGGWLGGTSEVLDANNPSEFNVPLVISGSESITIKNILVKGITTNPIHALSIGTSKDITLQNVHSQNNTILTGGAGISFTDGSIKIIDSSFNTNTGKYGLFINTYGNVYLENVDANGNSEIGAFVSNVNNTVAKTITINGINNFNSNGETGLVVNSKGAITLHNITAVNNSGTGADLNGSNSASITLNGNNEFSFNGAGGLDIESTGVIKINNLTAVNNTGDYAVRLRNVDAIINRYITLSGINNISHNNGGGMWIYSNGIVTINNLLIEETTNAQYALWVSTYQNILLNNVIIQNNTVTVRGVTLSTYGGTGAISITNSDFTNNSNAGLFINSYGVVTLQNVNAFANNGKGVEIISDSGINITGVNNFSFNSGDGLRIYNNGKFVNIKGMNVFESNDNNGLYITSNGSVTLSNLIAINNIQDTGVFVDNCFYNTSYYFCNNPVVSNVVVTGSNNFSNNGSDGLRVFSSGTITVSNVTANNNGTYANRLGVTFPNPDDYNAYGKGVFLHNYGAWTAKPITITGTNTFNGNASTGLFVYSYGAIKANNITANENGCDTLKDTNPNFCAGAYLDGNGVTLTGSSYFIDNARDGLIAYSYNVPISLSNLYAKGNDEAGVIVSAAANINILGTNTFLENNQAGLAVYSTGVVTLNNLTSNYNGFEGVYVDNSYATKPMAVIIKGTGTFNGNDTGLAVWSYGAITTNGIIALYNDYGVTLNNCLNDQNACTAYSPQPITMNGYNNISYNNEDGLDVRSAGVITVNNVVASSNLGGWGAFLDNWWDGAKGGITIKGYGIFSDNGDFHGLTVWSTGAVTLTNLTANGNARSGVVVLNNYDELKPANVTITGTNTFNLNNWNGLEIFTFGAVTLNNITANENNGANPNVNSVDFGVFIDNATNAVFARPVTLNGTNTFNNNIGGGLSIVSLGAIKVNNVMANGNQEGDGIKLNNQFDLFTSPVTISGYGVFNQNNSSGLLIYSNGMVTLANLTANQNMGFGVSIDNYYNASSTSTVNVTITGSNVFNNNGQSGLRITTDGVITVSNITANYNGEHGADLNNSNYANGAVKNIVLSGSNMFNNNILTGLTFSASGAVTLTRITANYNNDTVIGPELSAGVQGIAGGAITFTCGSLYNNEGNGFNLTGTIITLSGVYTSGTNSHVGTLKLTRACMLP
ncbi:MAG: hypothetical protein JNK81_01210 [Anaerolineales bacterium]|nr:hypothetical protein [Anaerolineales bacterium]